MPPQAHEAPSRSKTPATFEPQLETQEPAEMLQEISLPQHQPPADTQPQTETATAPASGEEYTNAWAKGQPKIPTDIEAAKQKAENAQNAQNAQQDAKDEL